MTLSESFCRSEPVTMKNETKQIIEYCEREIRKCQNAVDLAYENEDPIMADRMEYCLARAEFWLAEYQSVNTNAG